MTKKEKEDKRELARLYYMKGETQKQIAQVIGISEVTISKWAKSGNWDMKRATERVTRQELVLNNLQIISKLQQQVSEADNPLELSKSVSDQISKYSASIEKLDKKTNIIQIQEGFILFTRWLSEHPKLQSAEGFEFIKEIDKYQGEYLDFRFNNKE
jgi:transcriptional regulator with XRE-family HTH domain